MGREKVGMGDSFGRAVFGNSFVSRQWGPAGGAGGVQGVQGAVVSTVQLGLQAARMCGYVRTKGYGHIADEVGGSGKEESHGCPVE